MPVVATADGLRSEASSHSNGRFTMGAALSDARSGASPGRSRAESPAVQKDPSHRKLEKKLSKIASKKKLPTAQMSQKMGLDVGRTSTFLQRQGTFRQLVDNAKRGPMKINTLRRDLYTGTASRRSGRSHPDSMGPDEDAAAAVPSRAEVPLPMSSEALMTERLAKYALREKEVVGDGSCQFRSLSDQLFGSEKFHVEVRKVVVKQLKRNGGRWYRDFVMAESYDDYLREMARPGTWGDHVSLQAAADAYCVVVVLVTTFKDTMCIEIIPKSHQSPDGSLRPGPAPPFVWLSFHPEVHYNSLKPAGESGHGIHSLAGGLSEAQPGSPALSPIATGAEKSLARNRDAVYPASPGSNSNNGTPHARAREPVETVHSSGCLCMS
ncbi:unnamed protein product [Pedinophyceae sp. YPF-701]|nr:unnamed protein product [Pedinophyceae sp. YPF-701]